MQCHDVSNLKVCNWYHILLVLARLFAVGTYFFAVAFMKNSYKIQEAHFKNENTTQYRFKNYTTIAFLHDVEKTGAIDQKFMCGCFLQWKLEKLKMYVYFFTQLFS